ncbi:MAG: hypothetical protein ACRYFZ_01755 [Janthinobacterium lividum]
MGLRTEDPLDTARKRLREAGLIQFENGNGRGKTTLYTLLAPHGSILKMAAETPGERGQENAPLSPTDSTASEPEKGVEKGAEKHPPLEREEKEKGGEKGQKNTPDKGGTTIKKRKEESSAASAAPASASSSSEPAPKKLKAKGASHEEVAGLPLPFGGAAFAEAWLNFYTTNTKQAGKAITAFQLMLKKLGNYPEGFAVQMLERALMANWQGVEHGGTPRDLAEWQTEQARQPKPAPALPDAAPIEAPEMNPEFLAQQDAEQVAKRAARLAELTHA